MLRKIFLKIKIFNLDEIEKMAKRNEMSIFSFTDAIIFVGEINKEKLKFFKTLNENIICVDVYDTDNITDYIKFDTRNSVEMVLNYMFKLKHKKIGLLVGRNKVVENLLEDKPTAVFCGNDSIAMGAYRAIREKKLKIPEDMSIIGFNDLKLSKYYTPPLTTIKIDTKIIAQETVNSLVELLEGKRDYHKKVFLPIELIERQSCQKI